MMIERDRLGVSGTRYRNPAGRSIVIGFRRRPGLRSPSLRCSSPRSVGDVLVKLVNDGHRNRNIIRSAAVVGRSNQLPNRFIG
jgi:hypothetical protein